MRGWLLSCCLLLSSALASPAALADAADVERGRELYEALRYDEAAATLERALADATLSDEEREQALLLSGIVGVIRGDDDIARLRFAQLLEQAPAATLPPGLSPKITRVFDEVRAERGARSPPSPETTEAPPTARIEEASPPTLAVTDTSAPTEAVDDGELSPVAVGVAAGAAVGAAVLVVGAGALFVMSQRQAPASSLGTLQLP